MTFEDVRLGMTCRIKCVAANGACTCRLMELGLTPGTEFKVTKVAPFGDPVEIDVRGTRICLRKAESCDFQIERVG
jgi:ferrous iron transport protein A